MTERGSGTGADGIDVIPAPSRWDAVREDPMRRVGRVAPARAEPIAVLDSRAEPPVRPEAAPPNAEVATEPVGRGAAGAPHTSQ